MAYSQGRGVQMEAISEGMGGGWLFEVFFPGASYYSSGSGSPVNY